MENDIPKISVIVPVYNVEKYLDRCIQSILNQTLKELEIILVDDGSPDNCPALCDEYAQKELENFKNNGFYLRELLDKFKNDTKEIIKFPIRIQELHNC